MRGPGRGRPGGARRDRGPGGRGRRRRAPPSDPARTLVRGLFSGGTLCYESLVILIRLLGPVWSNTPLDNAYEVPAPDGSHVCLDLGEEEYTKGRPHPMIDPEARIEWMRKEGAGPTSPWCSSTSSSATGPTPTRRASWRPCARRSGPAAPGPRWWPTSSAPTHDPQGFAAQRARMEAAGCIVTATAARASLAAAAIALRQPDLVATRL